MTANDLIKRLGATVLNNKVRHPETGEIIARFEGEELVLTPEGVEVAASMPAKAPRAKAAPAVESHQEASGPDAPDAAPEAPAE